jgi:hypothetical protein
MKKAFRRKKFPSKSYNATMLFENNCKTFLVLKLLMLEKKNVLELKIPKVCI